MFVVYNSPGGSSRGSKKKASPRKKGEGEGAGATTLRDG